MKKFGKFICKNKITIIIVSCILLLLSVIGVKLTKVNYDILVYLPEDIETIKGQNILTDDFNMGSYSVALVNNASSSEILELEEKIQNVDGVGKVASIYDAIGTSIPIEMLPSNLVNRVHEDNSDLLLITFNDSTSNEKTINAVEEIRKITNGSVEQGGMSSMVLDTMNLSKKEIAIYIAIAVILCILVLELSFDSYFVPLLLLINIGCAILFNLGSNIFLGQISYITKALVAVLQLGVTTDFSIFLYHSYENEKAKTKTKEEAMASAIKNTFISVTGSSLTTIAGFLVLCTMQLTLGKDLGIVMAKGVLLGVITVLTLFPSLLLTFDKIIDKTKHKKINLTFNKLNKFVIKNHIAIFIIFIVLLVPFYLANSKVGVYYKLDKSLPNTLESIKTNEILKEKYNIVSPEIILVSKDLKNDQISEMITSLEKIDGIDFVLSFSKIKELGITEEMLDGDITSIFESDKYQMMLINSTYDIATDELNNQTTIINDLVKKYDDKAIVAGEGPLMKDLIEISDTDFNNVNTSSIICILIILFIVLKSLSLPLLLISTIEFAIFMNMGISYFSGTVLPFIAPIVLGTIQLGATIDYAILMTSTYLEKRKEGKEKNSAMLETLNYTGNSIFVSAMCFFAATFGVGIYSKIEMIGSLCSLISRGAIISMLVVILVLPSILLIFDKIIMKTTYKNRKEKNMKKLIKKVAVYIVICGILFTSVPVEALTKKETVYTKLNYDGSIKNTIVNEQLINTSNTDKIEDYSELKNILNISNDNPFTNNNNKLTWSTNGKDVFYQGTIDKNLPISLNITYKLDGEVLSIDDMLGKKGKVDITIKYVNNDKHTVLVNNNYKTLYTPFLVTFGTIIDSTNNSNISVTNGKVVSNGVSNIIVGLSTPGLYESLNIDELKNMDTITISYDTTKFELSAMYNVVTSKIIDSSDLSIFNKMDGLYSKVNELQNNMNTIDDGAKKISLGTSTLKNKLDSSIKELASDKKDALTSEQIEFIKNGAVSNVKSIFTDEYKNSIANNTWVEVSKRLDPNDDNIKKNVVDSVNKAVVEYLNSINEYQDYVNCETGKYVMQNNGTVTPEQMASCGVIQSDTTLPLIIKASTTSASETASKTASYVSEKITKEVSVNVAESTALQIATNLSESLSKEVANTVKSESLKQITSSLTELYEGVEKIDTSVNDLSKGISKFNEEGIKKIVNLVNNDVKNISSTVKELTNLGDDYQSYGNKNDNTDGETKFILVVDSKNVKKETKTVETTQEKTSLWTKIKNLFK